MDQQNTVEIQQLADQLAAQEYTKALYGDQYPDIQASAAATNELVNLFRDFVHDKSLKAQFEYFLKFQPPTPKAAHKLKIYMLFCINAQFVTSNIPKDREMLEQKKLHANYRLIVAQLPVGLTRYDINDSYIHLTSLIDHLYRNQLLRARGGFTMKRVSTKGIEVSGGEYQQDELEKDERTTLQKLGINRFRK